MFDFNKLTIVGLSGAIKYGRKAARLFSDLLSVAEQKLTFYSYNVYEDKIKDAVDKVEQKEPVISNEQFDIGMEHARRLCKSVIFYDDNFEEFEYNYSKLFQDAKLKHPFTSEDMNFLDNMRKVGFTYNDILNVCSDSGQGRGWPFLRLMNGHSISTIYQAFMMKYMDGSVTDYDREQIYKATDGMSDVQINSDKLMDLIRNNACGGKYKPIQNIREFLDKCIKDTEEYKKEEEKKLNDYIENAPEWLDKEAVERLKRNAFGTTPALEKVREFGIQDTYDPRVRPYEFTDEQKEFFKCAVSGEVTPRLKNYRSLSCVKEELNKVEGDKEFTDLMCKTIEEQLNKNHSAIINGIKQDAEEAVADVEAMDEAKRQLSSMDGDWYLRDSAALKVFKDYEDRAKKLQNYMEEHKKRDAETFNIEEKVVHGTPHEKNIEKIEEIKKIGEGKELSARDQLQEFLDNEVIKERNKEIVEIDTKMAKIKHDGTVKVERLKDIKEELKSYINTEEKKEE